MLKSKKGISIARRITQGLSGSVRDRIVTGLFLMVFIPFILFFALVGLALKWREGPPPDDFLSEQPFELRARYRSNCLVKRSKKQPLPTSLLTAAADRVWDDDYVVLVDRSGSMGGRSWVDTQRTVQFLVTWLNEFVDNGVSLYFFDESCDHVPHVKSAAEVATAFDAHLPRGSTDLARALHGVLRTHLQSMRGATRVLVLTDGCPDSYADTKRILTRAARSVSSTKALSISLLQVGADAEATKYLHHLRDDLAKEAEADIVDIRTTGEYAPLTLCKYVKAALRQQLPDSS